MKIDFVKDFIRRRRKGAVALVAVAAMVPTAGMMTASLNSSQMIDDRRATQDASDAISRMHGVWSARSMNILSMNSITGTQLLVVALGSESLQGTLLEQITTAGLAIAHITSHGGRECQARLPFGIDAWWPAVCWAIHGVVMIPAIIATVRSFQIMFEYDPAHGIETARRGLDAIEAMNREIIARLPRSIHEIGEDYAEVFEIEAFHFDNPCDSDLAENCESGRTHDGMALPVEEGDLMAHVERCLLMQVGTTIRATGFNARGFPISQGPLRETDSNQSVRDFINEETEIGEVLEDFKDAYDDGWASRLPRWLFIGFTDHPGWANLQGSQDADGPNSFTRRYDGKQVTMCAGFSLDHDLPGFITGVPPIFESPIPTPWTLPGISPFDVNRPTDPREMDEEFHILAFAQVDGSDRVGTEVFRQFDEPHNGYGQTGLYNADGADIYSGNWRYRLMPAMRLDQPRDVADRMNDRAPEDFMDLVEVLRAINHLQSWERINAH